ncbi:MAG: rhomboid family intramembrane serine protease [Opitutales bacterium]
MPSYNRFLKDFWPVVTIFVICGAFFAVDLATREGWHSATDPLMMVPAEVYAAWQAVLEGELNGERAFTLATTLTHALLHADGEHLLMNMLLIWVFGSLVLQELGAVWFFAIFIVTALTGGIGQVLLDPNSPIPALGASGALMGLEGVYLGMALRWRLPDPDVWPIAEPIPPGRLILLAVVGLAMDVSGILSDAPGIAYGAHLGGFVGGSLIATTIIPKPRQAK